MISKIYIFESAGQPIFFPKPANYALDNRSDGDKLVEAYID